MTVDTEGFTAEPGDRDEVVILGSDGSEGPDAKVPDDDDPDIKIVLGGLASTYSHREDDSGSTKSGRRALGDVDESTEVLFRPLLNLRDCAILPNEETTGLLWGIAVEVVRKALTARDEVKRLFRDRELGDGDTVDCGLDGRTSITLFPVKDPAFLTVEKSYPHTPDIPKDDSTATATSSRFVSSARVTMRHPLDNRSTGALEYAVAYGTDDPIDATILTGPDADEVVVDLTENLDLYRALYRSVVNDLRQLHEQALEWEKRVCAHESASQEIELKKLEDLVALFTDVV